MTKTNGGHAYIDVESRPQLSCIPTFIREQIRPLPGLRKDQTHHGFGLTGDCDSVLVTLRCDKKLAGKLLRAMSPVAA